jgi:hypothetical protein
MHRNSNFTLCWWHIICWINMWKRNHPSAIIPHSPFIITSFFSLCWWVSIKCHSFCWVFVFLFFLCLCYFH